MLDKRCVLCNSDTGTQHVPTSGCTSDGNGVETESLFESSEKLVFNSSEMCRHILGWALEGIVSDLFSGESELLLLLFFGDLLNGLPR